MSDNPRVCAAAREAATVICRYANGRDCCFCENIPARDLCMVPERALTEILTVLGLYGKEAEQVIAGQARIVSAAPLSNKPTPKKASARKARGGA